MNAGQLAGSASMVLGLAAECAPVQRAGTPCGVAAYVAATDQLCRSSALPWVLIGAVLVVGGAFITAAASPPPAPGRVPWVQTVAWLVVLGAVVLAFALVVAHYGIGSA